MRLLLCCQTAARQQEYTYREIDVTFDRAGRDAMTARADDRTSVPQIFINDNGIGGCDELHALEHAGRLDQLLTG